MTGNYIFNTGKSAFNFRIISLAAFLEGKFSARVLKIQAGNTIQFNTVGIEFENEADLIIFTLKYSHLFENPWLLGDDPFHE
jgi:hypothetical protein